MSETSDSGFSLGPHGIGDARPAFPTVHAMFCHAAETVPDMVALRQGAVTLTYQEERRAALALARRIALTVRPGQAVALLLPNSPAFRVAYQAAIMARVTPALLNPHYPAAQLGPLLHSAEARAVICAPATHAMVAELANQAGFAEVICLDRDISLADLLAEKVAPSGLDEPQPGDVAALMFTGGTTGLPKGVEHTQARLMEAIRRMEWIWPTRLTGEVWLPVAPFTHIYGFLQGLLCPVYARAQTIIPERFQPKQVVELMARHRVTVFGGGPPAIYAGLLAAPELASADLRELRVCPAGGAPFPAELMDRWREATGCSICEGYGMTEISPIAGTNELTGSRPGAVGKAVPGVQIGIVALEDNARVLPLGEIGEVRVRGPQMMEGYRNQPEETAAAVRDGWMLTGDIGRIGVDGFLFITDRKKDIVLVKGFNVFPREVEEVLYAHPKLAAAGVVGVADTRTGGERLFAFVVPRQGEAVEVDDVAAHCASRLVAYSRPSEIRIVEKLPMTGAQKLDRIALRNIADDLANDVPELCR